MGEMLFSRPAGYRARCAPFSRNAWKGSQGSRCHLTPPRLSGKLGFLPLHPPGESRRDNLWCACRTAWVKCFSPSPPTTGLAVRLTPAIHGKALSVDFHSPLRADWQRLRHKAAFPPLLQKTARGSCRRFPQLLRVVTERFCIAPVQGLFRPPARSGVSVGQS